MRVNRRIGAYTLFTIGIAAGLAWGFVSLHPVRAAGEPKPAPPRSIREVVWDFERSLEPLPEPERARKVRQFFAGLKDSASRIEAIGMMDDRYVYVVPKSVQDEILGALLEDPDVRVRARAAAAVAYNGLGSQHAEALLALLKTETPEVKASALYAMARSRDERFVAPIREHLSHPNPQVRINAAFGLWTLQPDAKELELLLADPEPAVRSSVVQIIPRAAGSRRLLGDPSPTVRERAARAIGNGGDREQAPAVAPLLKDPEPLVRAAAAYALGRLRAADYGSQIEVLLRRDEDVIVRRYAAQALADLRSEKHLAGLRAALNDEDEQVRKYAARAIRLIEDPQLDPDTIR
jgi:HEAT repeat protein